MEDLFPILLFLLILIGSALKQAARAFSKKRKARPKKPSGALLEKLKELLQEAERVGRRRSGGEARAPGSPLEDLFPVPQRTRPAGETFPWPEETEVEPAWKYGDWVPTTPRREKLAGDERETLPDRRRPEHPVSAAQVPVAPAEPRARVVAPAVRKVDLRSAVIWSEILGPPLALRDRRGE